MSLNITARIPPVVITKTMRAWPRGIVAALNRRPKLVVTPTYWTGGEFEADWSAEVQARDMRKKWQRTRDALDELDATLRAEGMFRRKP